MIVRLMCTCCDGDEADGGCQEPEESATMVAFKTRSQVMCKACAMRWGGSREEYEAAGLVVLAHVDDGAEAG